MRNERRRAGNGLKMVNGGILDEKGIGKKNFVARVIFNHGSIKDNASSWSIEGWSNKSRFIFGEVNASETFVESDAFGLDVIFFNDTDGSKWVP